MVNVRILDFLFVTVFCVYAFLSFFVTYDVAFFLIHPVMRLCAMVNSCILVFHFCALSVFPFVFLCNIFLFYSDLDYNTMLAAGIYATVIQIRGLASYKTRFNPPFLHKKIPLPSQK